MCSLWQTEGNCWYDVHWRLDTRSACFVGDGSRRSLLQTGSALNSLIPNSATGTQSAFKEDPTGNECYIASSRSAVLDCGKVGVGSLLQQVPSCCTTTSLSSSNDCSSLDSAGAIICVPSSGQVYPACCTLRWVKMLSSPATPFLSEAWFWAEKTNILFKAVLTNLAVDLQRLEGPQWPQYYSHSAIQALSTWIYTHPCRSVTALSKR